VKRRSVFLFLAVLIATCPAWCLQVHACGHSTHEGRCGELGGGLPAPAPVNDDACVCAGAIVAEECLLVIDVMCDVRAPLMLDWVALDAGALPVLFQRAGLRVDGPDLSTSSLNALAASQRYRC
jgi:hypothetical protein